MLLGIGIGYDGLEKLEDVVGLSRSFVWSAERTMAGSELEGDVMVSLHATEAIVDIFVHWTASRSCTMAVPKAD